MRRLAFALGLLSILVARPGAAAGGPAEDVLAALEQLRGQGFPVEIGAYRGVPEPTLLADLRRLLPHVSAAATRPGATAALCTRHVLLSNPHDKERFDADAVLAAERELVKEVKQYLPGKAGITLRYPSDPAISRPDGSGPLRVVLVPGGKVLDEVLERLRAELDASPSPVVPHAGTLWFVPFDAPGLEKLRCAVPTAGVLGGPCTNPQLSDYVATNLQGKVVSQGKLLDRAAGVIATNGSGLLGRCQTYDRHGGAYVVRYDVKGEPLIWTWAVPVADANGAARWNRSEPRAISGKAYMTQVPIDERHGGRYENQYGGLVGKKLGRHHLSVLPVPRPVGSDLELRDKVKRAAVLHVPQERLTVTRDMLAAHPVMVLRKSATWRPFMEDADWDDRMSFHGEDRDTALALVIGADASDAEVGKAVRAYYGSPSPAHASGADGSGGGK